MSNVIITVREAINTGKGLTKVIEAEEAYYFNDGHMVRYQLAEGGGGDLPIRNISGIVFKQLQEDRS